jgi:hypothetical protein
MKKPKDIPQPVTEIALFQDLSALIEQSRRQVARVANSALTLLFWKVGKGINEHILC